MPDAPDDKKEAPEAAPAAPQPAHMPLYMSIIYIAASMLLWSTRGLSMYFISANTQQIQGSLGATLTEPHGSSRPIWPLLQASPSCF